MTDSTALALHEPQASSVIPFRPAAADTRPVHVRIAERFRLPADGVMDILAQTCFRGQNGTQPTYEQMAALLVVADQFGLNPFIKEIYAFPAKGGGIVPLVSVDGWNRIVNEHPQFRGFEITLSDDSGKPAAWAECKMYRRDRDMPTVVREYLTECKATGGPLWNTMPNRMLRHRAFMQAARMAFGFAGIHDEDEGRYIANGGPAYSPAQAARDDAAADRGDNPPPDDEQADALARLEAAARKGTDRLMEVNKDIGKAMRAALWPVHGARLKGIAADADVADDEGLETFLDSDPDDDALHNITAPKE